MTAVRKKAGRPSRTIVTGWPARFLTVTFAFHSVGCFAWTIGAGAMTKTARKSPKTATTCRFMQPPSWRGEAPLPPRVLPPPPWRGTLRIPQARPFLDTKKSRRGIDGWASRKASQEPPGPEGRRPEGAVHTRGVEVDSGAGQSVRPDGRRVDPQAGLEGQEEAVAGASLSYGNSSRTS